MMWLDNSSQILEEIGDLENAISKVQLQLDVLAKELSTGFDSNDEKALYKKLKLNLQTLLVTSFPKVVRLLGSISGDVAQLSSLSQKNEGVKDELWNEVEISPDNIKIEGGNDVKTEDESDLDPCCDVDIIEDSLADSLLIEESLIDVNEYDFQSRSDPLAVDENGTYVATNKRTHVKRKSRIRPVNASTPTIAVKPKRERKQNLKNVKFMSSCKNGEEITPLTPFVLLIDNVKDKRVHNIESPEGGDVPILFQRLRQRGSFKKSSDNDSLNSSSDQDNEFDSGDKDEFKSETNPSDTDQDEDYEGLSRDSSDEYAPSTKITTKKLTRRRRTKVEILEAKARQGPHHPKRNRRTKVEILEARSRQGPHQPKRKRKTKLELLEARSKQDIDHHRPKRKRRTKLEILQGIQYSQESTCSICSDTFPNRNKLKEHVLVKHPLSYFDMFTPQNITSEEWTQCLNLVPGGTADEKFPFKCNICGKPIPTISSVRSHIPTHNGDLDEAKHQCEQCGKLMKSKAHLGIHLRRVHADKTNLHTCSCCNRAFITPRSLQIHMLRKEKQKLDGVEKKKRPTFSCHICNKVLTSRPSLQGHMRVHAGTKPLLCPHPGCGARFRHKGSLDHHFEGLHSEVEKYVCKVCGKKFRWRESHKHHMQSHAGPSILCSMCPLMFIRKENLKKHMNAVHNQLRPHACHLCPKNFKQRAHLKYHLNTHQNPGGRQRGLNNPGGRGRQRYLKLTPVEEAT